VDVPLLPSGRVPQQKQFFVVAAFVNSKHVNKIILQVLISTKNKIFHPHQSSFFPKSDAYIIISTTEVIHLGDMARL